jgi:hypothetical protein
MREFGHVFWSYAFAACLAGVTASCIDIDGLKKRATCASGSCAGSASAGALDQGAGRGGQDAGAGGEAGRAGSGKGGAGGAGGAAGTVGHAGAAGHADTDSCPDDPQKTAPGICGCGVAENADDSDHDGTIDCKDICPNDSCSTPGLTVCTAAGVGTCNVDAKGCKTLVSTACASGICFDDKNCATIVLGDWGKPVTGMGIVKTPAIDCDEVGNAYVVGTVSGAFDGVPALGDNDGFISKWDATGTRQWTRVFGGASDDQATGISVDFVGYVMVTGGSSSNLKPTRTATNAFERFVVAFGTNPTATTGMPWIYQTATGKRSIGLAAAVGPEGEYYVGGYEGDQGEVAGQTAMLLRIHTPDGTEKYKQSWSPNTRQAVVDVATNSNDVFAFTIEHDAQNVSRGVLSRHDYASGDTTWELAYPGLPKIGDFEDPRADINTDPSSNAVVLVRLESGTILSKVNSAGTELWQVPIADDASVPGGADGIATDSSGTLYLVTGSMLQKRSGEDGKLLWSTTVAGVHLRGIAVSKTPEGNVRVAAVGTTITQPAQPRFVMIRGD